MMISAVGRLRRLRWVLCLLFTTMNAVGLIVLAAVGACSEECAVRPRPARPASA